MILYLASNNPGKLKELREAAQACDIQVEPVPGLGNFPPCVEDGRTFEENAVKKGLYYSCLTDGLLMTDDSGICVDSLGGAPGIHSARFAGPAATDEENNQKLLVSLRSLEITSRDSSLQPGQASRAAHYVCVISLAKENEILTTTEGRANGIILEAPRGKWGFGYDPLFLFPQLGKTFAEMEPAEKFKVSHRGEAFRRLLEYLGEMRID